MRPPGTPSTRPAGRWQVCTIGHLTVSNPDFHYCPAIGTRDLPPPYGGGVWDPNAPRCENELTFLDQETCDLVDAAVKMCGLPAAQAIMWAKLGFTKL